MFAWADDERIRLTALRDITVKDVEGVKILLNISFYSTLLLKRCVQARRIAETVAKFPRKYAHRYGCVPDLSTTHNGKHAKFPTDRAPLLVQLLKKMIPWKPCEIRTVGEKQHMLVGMIAWRRRNFTL